MISYLSGNMGLWAFFMIAVLALIPGETNQQATQESTSNLTCSREDRNMLKPVINLQVVKTAPNSSASDRIVESVETLTNASGQDTYRILESLQSLANGQQQQLLQQNTHMINVMESLSNTTWIVATGQQQQLQMMANQQQQLQAMTNQTNQLLATLNTLVTLMRTAAPRPRDCSELLAGQRSSGRYVVYDGSDAFTVYCDMESDGGGWTVFQRRQDGLVDFERDWADYRQGFGDVSSEFWLGLERLHHLTQAKTSHLRVDMSDWEGNTAYAEYSNFIVAGEDDQYRLSISGFSGTAESCPGGWSQFSTSCYYTFQGLEEWSSARQTCQELGSYLVVIDSDDENEFVNNLAKGVSFTNVFKAWINCNNAGRSLNDWVCGEDDHILTYDNWKPTEPNDFANENCAEMYDTGVWNDNECDADRIVICEQALGDSMTHHSGKRFSTRDRDNDASSRHCAQECRGAWWYSNCANSNLNGVYRGPGNGASYSNIAWYHWKRSYYALKTVEMKLRPA